jgi:hypothetical protein
MIRVCLVTTGQPSTTPRLVKEADALTANGYRVHVVGAHWIDWADASDRVLLASRRWTSTIVDWRQPRGFARYARARHWLARHAPRPRWIDPWLAPAALSRVGPELRRAAGRVAADLYIAHTLGALPIACEAAARHGAFAGFDAEDFHSGQWPEASASRAWRLARRLERTFVPRCAYVTAAAPAIATAYADLCGIPVPETVLNVAPLADRPAAFRRGADAGPLQLYWYSQTIGPDRGLEDVVRAMGRLGPGVILHLRGRWQAGYESVLKAIAAGCGVAAQRIVSHPPAPHDEMVRLAGTYDIGLAVEPGVTPNNRIAVSNKLFTYLLAGASVLATRTAGQAALRADLGPAAQWCEPRDPESLASALRPWLENRTALRSARAHAWMLGERRFNWDREQLRFLRAVAAALTDPHDARHRTPRESVAESGRLAGSPQP